MPLLRAVDRGFIMSIIPSSAGWWQASNAKKLLLKGREGRKISDTSPDNKNNFSLTYFNSND